MSAQITFGDNLFFLVFTDPGKTGSPFILDLLLNYYFYCQAGPGELKLLSLRCRNELTFFMNVIYVFFLRMYCVFEEIGK